MNARAKSKEIENINKKYLGKWFSRVLKPDETSRIDLLFYEFGKADPAFVAELNRFADAFEPAAKELARLMDQGKYAQAAETVRGYEEAWLPRQRKLTDLLLDLRTLRDDFNELTGALPG
jgi:hypothetical protein